MRTASPVPVLTATTVISSEWVRSLLRSVGHLERGVTDRQPVQAKGEACKLQATTACLVPIIGALFDKSTYAPALMRAN